MPNDNIARAIKRGTGGGDEANYEEITYEGYGPGGAALVVNVLTDNRNRTASDLRHAFSRHGGNLGETGCVSWMFEPKGLLTVDPETNDKSEDELLALAMEAGAEDLRREGEAQLVVTAPDSFEAVRRFMAEHDVPFAQSELGMVPQNTVEIGGRNAEQLSRLLEALDEHDDVQSIYGNFNFVD